MALVEKFSSRSFCMPVDGRLALAVEDTSAMPLE
ncbi:Uncharacterised protein [uncultured archaeon]|nr:Uncharacterised protein [uncultured archaeon]